MQNGTAAVEDSLVIPKKLNLELPYEVATPFLGLYPKELKAGAQTDTAHRYA